MFRFIFGNPDHKEWTLSLYNALNHSHYTNPDDLVFNTIDDAMYIGMKNDVSFIVSFVMCIWEHQSTYSPNVVIRIFLYASRLYEKYIVENGFNRFSRKLFKLPKPKCICFYNGTDEQPEEELLKLSDAFEDDGLEPDIEVRVHMLNVNYGKNRALMEQCRPMMEYSWLIDAIRRHEKILGNLDAAMDAAIDEMPDDFVLKKFLLAHRTEVKGMYFTEWYEAQELEAFKNEERAEARAEGIKEYSEQVASDMLKENLPLTLIAKISRLSENTILNLAQSLGINVVAQ